MGGDCSKKTVRAGIDKLINPDVAEDEACLHGKCLCGTCTGPSKKLPNGEQCSENSDCESDWREGKEGQIIDVTIGCSGRCRARRNHETAFKVGITHDGNSCNNYKRQHICGKCGDKNGRVDKGYRCSKDNDCSHGRSCNPQGDMNPTTVDCNGKCGV